MAQLKDSDIEVHREFDNGQYQGVINKLEQKKNLNPWLHWMLGKSYFKTNRYMEAMSHLKYVVSTDLDDIRPEADLRKEFENVIKNSPNIFVLNCKNMKGYSVLGEAYSMLGKAYFECEFYEDAIDPLEKAIGFNPEDVNLYSMLGKACSKANLHIKSINALNKAIELNPKDVNLYSMLGRVCLDLKSYRRAIKAFKKVIQLDPKHVDSFWRLGGIYQELKEYDKAIEAFHKGSQINGSLWAQFCRSAATVLQASQNKQLRIVSSNDDTSNSNSNSNEHLHIVPSTPSTPLDLVL